MNDNRKDFRDGLKTGIPIALGYFAVSFTLGIAARNAGLNAFQASVSSAGCMASAGQFIGYTTIIAGAGLTELAIMEIIANARYVLMSCSLSQKIPPETPLLQRIFLGYCVTDEIFGVSMAVPGRLNPFFTYGVMTICVPGWTLGTCLGVIMGNLLPDAIVRALSVGLYGMFIAVIIPPARESKVILGVVVVSMAASWAFTVIPGVRELSMGIRTIILTLILAGGAALLFPVHEDEPEEAQAVESDVSLTHDEDIEEAEESSI